MQICDSSIAVFDSGVGGISVLRELAKELPNENFIYFGDSAHAPYGTKTARYVRELAMSNVQMLLNMGAKAVVIACNTATSVAITTLRDTWPNIPIVGMEPAVKPAALHAGSHQVLVMATPMTLRRRKFQKLMRLYGGNAKLIPLPCPGLVELIEAGEIQGEIINNYLSNLLSPYINPSLDSVVLGCTHYPFVVDTIKEILGENTVVFDGIIGTAKETHRRLSSMSLLSKRTGKGDIQIFNSLPQKISLCKKLFEL